MFTEEFDFFIKNQNQLVDLYNNKVIVIKGQSIIGVYPDALSAYIETQKEHPLGSFMIQPCFSGKDAYTVEVF